MTMRATEQKQQSQSTSPEQAPSPSATQSHQAQSLPAWIQRQSLTVNAPDDVYEQEARAIADQVMRMPAQGVQRRCACGGVAGADGECAACKAKRLQRQADGGGQATGQAPPSVNQTLSQAGQPLDGGTRSFMESRFGHNFEDVRVHTNTQAAQSAAEVKAAAYTVGRDVVFGAGQYQPQTSEGKRLIAHELVHTVQQGTGLPTLVQRECSTSAPTQEEREFVYTRSSDGQRLRAAFERESSAEQFISENSNPNIILTCYHIRGEYVVYWLPSSSSVRQRASTGGTAGNAATLDEIFTSTEIDRMKDFLIRNASGGSPRPCINTVRSGIGALIYDNTTISGRSCPSPLTTTTRNTMEETMAQLGTHSMSQLIATIRFQSAAGTEINAGSGLEPMSMRTSAWNEIISVIGTRTGFSVFGLSICDGYHSVLLTVDHNDLDNIRIYWSDQTELHPVMTEDRLSGLAGNQYGWERMQQSGTSTIDPTTPRSLDEYLRYATRVFWGVEPASRARGNTPLTHAERLALSSLGTCVPVIRIWRISRPNP